MGGIETDLPKPVRIRSQAAIKAVRQDHCERCGASANGLPHHIRTVGSGGSDTKENQIQLCFDCHRATHDGKIERDELVALVAKREGKAPEEIYQAIGLPVPEDCPARVLAAPPFGGRTLDDLIQLYVSLKESEEETRWQRAAIVVAMVDAMKIPIRKVSGLLGCSPAQVREMARTWRAFPTEESRAKDLTWYHHRLAATTNDPEGWIEQAAANLWSTRQMSEAVKGSISERAETDLVRAKAEKAVRMVREVLESGGAPAQWLISELAVLLRRPEEEARQNVSQCAT